jgi:pimeloyl-ACP methyl ester carboxylesterase
LILVGELDRPEMLEIAERLEAEIPNARRETIAGTAHVANMERPEEFDRLVLDFLS